MKKETLRLLVLGDLHGKIPKIPENNYDIVICTGDVCGDGFRNESKGISLLSFFKNKQKESRSLIQGRKVMEFLNSLPKPVVYVPGNWDYSLHLDGIYRPEWKKKFEYLTKELPNIHNIEYTKKTIKGLTFIGYGSTSGPEILTLSQERGDKEMEERYYFFQESEKTLTSLFESSKNTPVVFLTHNVPHNTKLDIIYAPNNPLINNKHYGSKIARKIIENYSPILSIGGHIHEGYGKTKIAETSCINAGYGEHATTYVEVNLKTKKVETIEFKRKE